MEHNIKNIAFDHRIDATALTRFALKNRRKYGIVNDNGFITTTTFYVNDLVNDFNKMSPDEQNKFKKKFLMSLDIIGLTLDGTYWNAGVETVESGVVVWSSKQCPEFVIYATPNWDVEGQVPFELYDNKNEDYKNVAKIEFSDSTPLELQREMYLAVIKTIIKSL